jgi:hypothetical protein
LLSLLPLCCFVVAVATTLFFRCMITIGLALSTWHGRVANRSDGSTAAALLFAARKF